MRGTAFADEQPSSEGRALVNKNILNFTGYEDNMQMNQYSKYGLDTNNATGSTADMAEYAKTHNVVGPPTKNSKLENPDLSKQVASMGPIVALGLVVGVLWAAFHNAKFD